MACSGEEGAIAPPVADERAEGLVVFALIFDHLVQDSNAGFVAKFLDLLCVLCDVAAFVQLQTPQRQANAAYSIGQRVGFAGFWSAINRVRTT